ncbi:MAG: response regulator [Chloroflexota bacterium]
MMGRKRTILIVDDDADVRQLLGTVLAGEDYVLAFANDGVETLQKAAELMPDLVLLDVMMPVMNGFDTCQRLRADPRLAEVPVIMITALDDLESRVRGIQSGADDFVSKPFEIIELQARVRTVTQLNRYRQLLSERAKFEWVVTNAEDGYVIVDNADHVQYANPKARAYLGLQAFTTDLPPEKFLQLAKKLYRCEPQETWSVWPEQSVVDVHLPRYLLRPETEVAPALWLQVDIFHVEGQPGGSVVRLRDATIQIAFQRDTWKFHSAVAHKFRTPLGAITYSLDLLRNHASSLSPAQINDLYDSALSGVQRLRNDIDDIVHYLNAPAVAQTGGTCTIARLGQMITQIAASRELKSVSVTGHEVLSRREVLLPEPTAELVLQEILENAVKFHPTHAPRVEITFMQQERNVVSLRISNDGGGLAPERLARLWMPYYQSEKFFTGEVPGMGLGLSIVASVLWEAGGSYRIYNRTDAPGVVVELTLQMLGE